jgi:hypothetical protein
MQRLTPRHPSSAVTGQYTPRAAHSISTSLRSARPQPFLNTTHPPHSPQCTSRVRSSRRGCRVQGSRSRVRKRDHFPHSRTHTPRGETSNGHTYTHRQGGSRGRGRKNQGRQMHTRERHDSTAQAGENTLKVTHVWVGCRNEEHAVLKILKPARARKATEKIFTISSPSAQAASS